MAELVTGQDNPGPIRIPAWDEVIHIAPRPEISPAQRRQFNTWRAAELARPTTDAERAALAARITSGEYHPPGMTRAEALEIQRRQAMAESIRASAVPEWRQKMTRILTALDNIEDDLSTFERITRPILQRHPVGRAIDLVLRGTSNALDRMEKILAGPQIIGRREKRRAKQDRKPNVRTRQGKAGKLQSAVNFIKQNWGGLLEGAQSTDNHMGIGLQLGAIYGAIEETQDRAIISAWEAAKWATAQGAANIPFLPADLREILQRQADDSAAEIVRVGQPLTAQIAELARTAGVAFGNALTPAGVIKAISEARGERGENWFTRMTGITRSAAYIGQSNPPFSPGEHALALYHAARSGAILAQTLDYTLPRIRPEQLAELPAARARVTNPVTREILQNLGVTLDAKGYGVGLAAERPLTLAQAIERGIPDYFTNSRTWLAPSPASEPESFTHALAESTLPACAHILTGNPQGIADRFEPEVRAEMMLYELGLHPPPGTARAAIAAWLADQVAAIEAAPDDYDQRTAARVTARHWPIAPALAG